MPASATTSRRGRPCPGAGGVVAAQGGQGQGRRLPVHPFRRATARSLGSAPPLQRQRRRRRRLHVQQFAGQCQRLWHPDCGHRPVVPRSRPALRAEHLSSAPLSACPCRRPSWTTASPVSGVPIPVQQSPDRRRGCFPQRCDRLHRQQRRRHPARSVPMARWDPALSTTPAASASTRFVRLDEQPFSRSRRAPRSSPSLEPSVYGKDSPRSPRPSRPRPLRPSRPPVSSRSSTRCDDARHRYAERAAPAA